jgi:hypothetical protein
VLASVSLAARYTTRLKLREWITGRRQPKGAERLCSRAPRNALPAQRLRQLGEVGSNAPRLIPGQQFSRRSPAGLFFVIDISLYPFLLRAGSNYDWLFLGLKR